MNQDTRTYRDAIDVLEEHAEKAEDAGDTKAAREFSRSAEVLKSEAEE